MGKKRRRQRGAPSTQQRSGGRSPQTDLITAETANPQQKLTSGRDPGPVDLLLLQRTVGNQAVARLIAGQNSDAIQRGPEEENKGKKSGGGKWRPKLKPRKSPPKKNKSRPKKKTKRRVFPKAPAKGTGALLNDRLDTFKNFKTAYSKDYTELPAHMLEAMINNLEAKIAPQKETIRKLEENVTKATKWDEVMATRTLLQKVTYGPFAPKSAEFNLIGKHLTDFHNDSRSYKFNPDKWFTNLQSLSTAVKNWLSKYDSMWKSRKGVRNTIKELKKQVEVGLKKLKGVQPDRKRAKELGEKVDELEKKKTKLVFKRSDVWRRHVIKYRDVARLANLAHLLEAYDHPKHRTAEDLQPRFQEWLAQGNEWSPVQGSVPRAFYRYVDKWEKTNKKELKKITYLGQKERQAYKLQFGGKVTYQQSKKPYKNGMYVMSPDGQFYGGQEEVEENGKQVSFHHSSFMAGMPIAAAGHLKVGRQGFAFVLDLESGHYQPLTRHMVKAVKSLATQHSISLKTVGVQPFASEFHTYSKAMSGERFLQELTWLKKNWNENKPVDTSKNAQLLGAIITNKRRKSDAYAQLKDAKDAL